MNIPSHLSRDPARPIVAFDPSGLVFAVAHHSKYIRLYDARNFDAVRKGEGREKVQK